MHALYVLIVYRDRLRIVIEYAIAAGIACLLFGPWLLMMLRTAASGGQLRRYLFLKVPQTYFSFLFGDALIPLDEYAVQHIRETLIQHAGVLIAAIAVSAIVAVFSVRAIRQITFRHVAAIVVMGVGPVILCLIISLVKVPMFDERYVLSSTPFVYLAVALGLWQLITSARQQSGGIRYLAGAVICTYVVLLGMSLGNYYLSTWYGKEQWREAFQYLERRIPPTHSIIVFDPDFFRVAQQYYGERDIPSLLVTGDVRSALLSSDARIREVLRPNESVWLVRSHERDDDLVNAFRRVMTEESHILFPKANRINIYGFRMHAGQ